MRHGVKAVDPEFELQQAPGITSISPHLIQVNILGSVKIFRVHM